MNSRAGRPKQQESNRTRDPVEQASLDSFPASDSPGWIAQAPGAPPQAGRLTAPALATSGQVQIDQAVLDFLNLLTPQQRRTTLFPFDSAERFNWHYIPRSHKGILLRNMSEPLREAAMAILRAALSEAGYRRCGDIMRLEPIVATMEQDPETYDPGNYAVTIFGMPAAREPWGWRLDGHHLSINFTHSPETVAVTPTFFGANPAEVETGEVKGLRVLGAAEDDGRSLINSLSEAGRRQAVIRARAFSDILTGPGRELSLRKRSGLSLAEMKSSNVNLAMQIVERFITTMNPMVAQRERAAIRSAGIEEIHFAWAGRFEPRQPHYYRLHGPKFVIEYDNTQNDANHIHSVWHNPTLEFGGDRLRHHYDHPSHGHAHRR